MPWGGSPAYCEQPDPESFTESTVGRNWPVPPSISGDYRSSGSRPGQIPEQHGGIVAHQDLSASDLETTLPHCPRKKLKITQSEMDAKTPKRKCVTGNKHCQPGHCSANPAWSPLLEKALIELFPDSHTFKDCMERLIHAYQKSSSGLSHDHRLDVPSIDKSSSADWGQAERDNAGTKDFPIAISSESSDANSESGSDREIEGACHEENETDSENSEPAPTGIGDILNVANDSAGAISSEQNARDRPNPLSPNTNEQSSTDKRTTRRFGCPFYQRNPEKHQHHRPCQGPGWEAVHRVKLVSFLSISDAS
jgi:hypothetical protein